MPGEGGHPPDRGSLQACVDSATALGQRGGERGEDNVAAAEAAARRREDFQSEARPGFIESVVTVCPVEG